MGNTFEAYCRSRAIWVEVVAVYNAPGKKRFVANETTLAFAERKHYELLEWARIFDVPGKQHSNKPHHVKTLL